MICLRFSTLKRMEGTGKQLTVPYRYFPGDSFENDKTLP
jgi:hypothetical protein